MSQFFAHFFLGCFLVGFILTMISLMFGMDHHHDGFHIGGHHGGDPGHGGGHGGADHGGVDARPGASFFSYSGMLIFLTFFGGAGYILNRNASGMVLLVLFGAVGAGLAGALIVFFYLNQFLKHGDTRMVASDYHLPGTLARVTSGIRAGETGEITYVHGASRRTCGARSDESAPHPLGQEVMVVRYEKGIAYVRSISDELNRV